MIDPFPIAPPRALLELVQPVAESLGLPTLGLHFHEVLFAFGLYTIVGSVVSPAISPRICPNVYPKLNKRTRLSWDVHVVSLVQSILISVLSLYSIFCDEERKELRLRANWEARVWEYTGMGGLLQSFALGYFVWDLIMCAMHVDIFGWGMLAHAVSAVSVFALGYRPFIYFYAPVFLLYELSSPFLNVHWFCDKLGLTGSKYQAINGVFLTTTFFGCRLVWGNIGSFWVFYDVFHAIYQGRSSPVHDLPTRHWTTKELMFIHDQSEYQRLAFRGLEVIPLWLGLVYLASNLTLNLLNLYWFGKMIETIRTRFDPPYGTKGIGPGTVHYERPEKVITTAAGELANSATSKQSGGASKQQGSVKAARQRAEAAIGGAVDTDEGTHVQRVVMADGSRSIEVSESRTLRTRRKA